MKKFLIVIIFLFIMVVLFAGKISGILPVTKATTATDTDVTIRPGSVTYTPAGSKKSVTVKKPLEAVVKFSQGKLVIPDAGFCLIPKLGWNSTDKWYAGIRFFYINKFGLELMGNNQKAFLGADYRLPFIDQLTVGAGVDDSWFQPSFGIYVGLSDTLSL